MAEGETQSQSTTTESTDPIIIIQDGQTPPATSTNKTKTKVATLDVFRGLTIALLILVGNVEEWPQITHAPWNGCTLADFMMPFFLFLVGLAIALGFQRITKIAPAIKNVIARALKFLLWGIFLQGGFFHAPNDLSYGVNMNEIRWSGILQRIAFVYLVVALVEISTIKKRPKNHLPPGQFSIFKLYIWNWLFALCVLLVYFATTYGLYVPDWDFVVRDEDSAHNGKTFTVQCGVRGSLGPACNAVGYVDRQVLGINHLYHYPEWRRTKYCTESSPGEGPLSKDAPAWCWARFESEGLLSSISATLTSIIGVHYGHVLIHLKNHTQRLKHWVNMGLGFLILGIILHFTDAIPLNKQLYSFSYVCLTGGAAGLVFSAFYLLIDIWDLRRPFLLFQWINMNDMLIFVMAALHIFPSFSNGWYYNTPNNTLVYWIQKGIFIKVCHSRRVGMLMYTLFGEILFWGIVAGICHQLGIYWKL